MKRNSNTIVFWTIEIICGIIVLVCTVAMLAGDIFGHEIRIYALLQNSDSSEKNSFISGMHSAADESGIELIIVDSTGVDTPQEQRNTILREALDGADAFIIEPLPGEDAFSCFVEVSEISPVIFVETDIFGNSGTTVIQPDNRRLGTVLGEEVIKLRAQDKDLISVVCSNSQMPSIIDRYETLSDTLASAGMSCGNMIDVGKEPDRNLSAIYGSDIIVALDNDSLVMLGNYFAGKTSPQILGIGNSTEIIYLLDMGIIKCVVAPDEYMVGYNSISCALSKIKRKSGWAVPDDIRYYVINRENLYSNENEKVLYALSR